MKKTHLFFMVVMLAIVLIGCGTSLNDDDQGNADRAEDHPESNNLSGDESNQAEKQTPILAEQQEATLEIEGMEESTTLLLYQDEGIDFSAYIPEDMVGHFEQNGLNIFTNYNGQKNEDARMFIMEASKETVLSELETAGFTTKEPERFAYDFSDQEFQIEKQGFIGRVSFFTKHEQDYSIGYYYPEEFADGFSARSALIIDHLVWHD